MDIRCTGRTVAGDSHCWHHIKDRMHLHHGAMTDSVLFLHPMYESSAGDGLSPH